MSIRDGDFAIFEQRKTRASRVLAYEVIRIRVRKAFTVRDEFVPAAEAYPASESWGTDGFTFKEWDEALAKFLEMVSDKRKSAGRQPGGFKKRIANDEESKGLFHEG